MTTSYVVNIEYEAVIEAESWSEAHAKAKTLNVPDDFDRVRFEVSEEETEEEITEGAG